MLRRALGLVLAILPLSCATADEEIIPGATDSGSGATDSVLTADTLPDTATDAGGDSSTTDAADASKDATTEVATDGATDGVADGLTDGVVLDGSDATEIGDSGPCEDGVKGGLETDIDCGGGVCGKCAGGKRCNGATDCLSGKCLWDGSKNVCVDPAWCTNGTKDFFETDVDCGGTICVLRCSPGQKCGGNTDCTTSLCLWDGSKNVCVDKTVGCFDSTKSFYETDVDCGGTVCAARCAAGKGCGGNADCTTSLCLWSGSKNVCVDKTVGCFNSSKDFYETDVDCGGTVCAARCGPGKGCGGNADCTTSLCLWSGSANVCVDKATGCVNGAKDFYETDVDCGGTVCAARCVKGQKCGSGADCVSGTCSWTGSANVCG